MRALLVMLLAAGCGKGLDQLGIFPCANDYSCPSNYFCAGAGTANSTHGNCYPIHSGCDPSSSTPSCVQYSGQTRCALVQQSNSYVGECVPDLSTGGTQFSSCSATTNVAAFASFYIDNCASGLVCISLRPNAGACRTICAADSGSCTGSCGDWGLSFAAGAPRYGVCPLTPTCDLGANPCPSGHTCGVVPKLMPAGSAVSAEVVLDCMVIGTKTEGQSCSIGDCGGGLWCYSTTGAPGTYQCRKACNASTPCTTSVIGNVCQPITGFANGLGYCTSGAASGVAISITPKTVTLATGATQTFVVTVTGSANTAANFTVTEGASGGSVTSAGVYTAPSTPGTYHVVATAAADGSKTDTATVTVVLSKRIFVTSGQFANGNLGGLSGGDQKCNTAATNASLGGTWMAWLSDANTNAIDRLTDVGPWTLVDRSAVVFNHKSDMAGNPLVAINMYETTALNGGAASVWTGTSSGGTKNANTCAGWTTSASGTGHIGQTATSEWTDHGDFNCDGSGGAAHLYCVEQ